MSAKIHVHVDICKVLKMSEWYILEIIKGYSQTLTSIVHRTFLAPHSQKLSASDISLTLEVLILMYANLYNNQAY